MTAKKRLQANSIKGWLIVILFLFLSLKSCVIRGQALTLDNQEQGYTASGHVPADSTGEKGANPVYLGYELGVGTATYTLKSDLTQLNNLRVGNLGFIVGGVVANEFGKLKGNAGFYYSDASVPYSFDLFTARLSANVYLLRLGGAQYHTVEPYFVGSIAQQHIKFYGSYLDQNSTHNYSVSEEQFLGREITTQVNAGFGAEYQLESDQGNFIHLFAEVTYGVPVAKRSTREVFNRTHIINPVAISVGICFGKIKQHSK